MNETTRMVIVGPVDGPLLRLVERGGWMEVSIIDGAGPVYLTRAQVDDLKSCLFNAYFRLPNTPPTKAGAGS